MPSYPKLTSRRIKYPSPSGYVNIGKYVPPFEKNDTGFGFKGVVMEDSKSGKLQCCECGEWVEQLSWSHLRKHKLNDTTYKRKFGLLMSTALKSKRMRIIQSKVMIEMRKSNEKYRTCFKKNNQFAGNRKGKRKALEHQNKYGVCDLQIAKKVLELSKELNKTPSLIDLSKRYGNGFMTLLHSRYGSYIRLCHSYGLTPLNSNHNPKYTREYFLEKGMSNEPSTRILTDSECRALYRIFKRGVKQWKKAVQEMKK